MRRSIAGGACVVALVTAAAVSAPHASIAAPASHDVAVVVQAGGQVAAAERAVSAMGGRVTLQLPIVDGFAARVPQAGLAGLARLPGVTAVTPDEHIAVAGTTAPTNRQTLNSVYTRATNAETMWGRGDTGQGVTVALIDTGVSPVDDLRNHLVTGIPDPTGQSGTVDCVDFSGENSCTDTYGHGTFMAGLIVGDGTDSGGVYKGVAPGARILSVKIAGHDGSADVSKVLAAIQWVVSFKDRFGIRVLNLSLGTDSTASYRHDPLNFAVERAWRSGIAVVVAASNRGPDAGTISKPGDDPLVITVGAVDDRESPGVDDDRLPYFSGRGPTAADGLAKPDVVAPGAHLVSLRSPGSYVEAAAPDPTSLVAGTPYRRGSGTSMATAVTSGVAALVYAAHPEWQGDTRWPDRLKYALTATAQKVADRSPLAVGAGEVDAAAASDLTPGGLANQDVTVLSDGTGSLDGSRGTEYVTGPTCTPGQLLLDPQCDVVHGNETAQGDGNSWEGTQYTGTDWTETTWYASQWVHYLGNSWEGNSWEGNSWEGNSWEGNSWEGATWYGNADDTADYGQPVKGSSWYGAWG